jgi:hypothetical protein
VDSPGQGDASKDTNGHVKTQSTSGGFAFRRRDKGMDKGERGVSPKAAAAAVAAGRGSFLDNCTSTGEGRKVTSPTSRRGVMLSRATVPGDAAPASSSSRLVFPFFQTSLFSLKGGQEVGPAVLPLPQALVPRPLSGNMLGDGEDGNGSGTLRRIITLPRKQSPGDTVVTAAPTTYHDPLGEVPLLLRKCITEVERLCRLHLWLICLAFSLKLITLCQTHKQGSARRDCIVFPAPCLPLFVSASFSTPIHCP